MRVELEGAEIYVRAGSTDMRKQINGLSVLVQEELKGDIFSGALFLFCNRSRRIVKVLWWDRTGFCLWQKRLEGRRKFPWPKDREGVRRIDEVQLGMLLRGIDFWGEHREVKFSRVS